MAGMSAGLRVSICRLRLLRINGCRGSPSTTSGTSRSSPQLRPCAEVCVSIHLHQRGRTVVLIEDLIEPGGMSVPGSRALRRRSDRPGWPGLRPPACGGDPCRCMKPVCFQAATASDVRCRDGRSNPKQSTGRSRGAAPVHDRPECRAAAFHPRGDRRCAPGHMRSGFAGWHGQGRIMPC